MSKLDHIFSLGISSLELHQYEQKVQLNKLLNRAYELGIEDHTFKLNEENAKNSQWLSNDDCDGCLMCSSGILNK